MKISDIINSKFVRIIALIVVLYFAIFSHKDHPNSVSSSVSIDGINKNFDEVKQRTGFIVSNIKTAQNYDHQKDDVISNKKIIDSLGFIDEKYLDTIKTQILGEGFGDRYVNCLDEVVFNIDFYDNNNNKIKSMLYQTIVAGSNKNNIIAKKIVGMKKNSIIRFDLGRDLYMNNEIIQNLISNKDIDIYFEVLILDFKKLLNPEEYGLSCQFNNL